MKYVLPIASALFAVSTSALANPWDDVPPTPPYKNVADAVKATTPPGQQSALNPSCAGMTGDQCTKSAQAQSNSLPLQVTESKAPVPHKEY